MTFETTNAIYTIKYLLLKQTTEGECRVPTNFKFISSSGCNWWARICDHFIHASLDSFLQFLKVWGCKQTMRITCCYVLCTRNSPSWSMETHLASIHLQPSRFIPTKCYKHQIIGQRHPSKLSESTMKLEPLERPKPAFHLDLSYTTSVPCRRCPGQQLAPRECRLWMEAWFGPGCTPGKGDWSYTIFKWKLTLLQFMNWFELVPLVTSRSMAWVAYPLWVCGNLGTCYHLIVIGTPKSRATYQPGVKSDDVVRTDPSCKHPNAERTSHHFMEDLKVHSSIALKGMQNALMLPIEATFCFSWGQTV